MMLNDDDSDRRRWVLAILGGLFAAAVTAGVILAVSDGDNSSTSASLTTTTVAAATTLPVAPSTTPPVVPSVPITIPTKNDGTSADGSGCAPPAGDALPDGIWFGQLKAVDPVAGTVSLDLNCFFTGAAAAKANQQDNGGPGDPVENDYYIRNKVMKIYTPSAVSNVAVLELTAMGGGPLGAPQTGLNAAKAMLNNFSNSWIGWLEVSGGQVVVIQQQFVP